MVWAACPTHGLIQDADEVRYGGVVKGSYCKCGLACDDYTPEAFVTHDELKELQPSGKQPAKKRATRKKTKKKES